MDPVPAADRAGQPDAQPRGDRAGRPGHRRLPLRAVGRARLLLVTAAVLALLTLPVALLIAPPDAVQGQAQRWMYLHVPVAWSAYAAFAVVLVLSLQVLRTGRPASRPAITARAAAETGLVLTVLTLVTGSVWGKLSWGVWWAADARVLATVAMGCVYAAYLALVHLTRARSPRAAAVVGVAGFAIVPVVHMSVVWWRTLHQPPTILAPQAGLPIDPVMGLALGLSVLTLTLATAGLILARAAALSPADSAGARTGAADGARSRTSDAAPGRPSEVARV